jgi:hypothetical protein
VAVLKRVSLDRQIARTPLIAGFIKGDQKISLTNAHIYYGMATGEKRQKRLKEFPKGKPFIDLHSNLKISSPKYFNPIPSVVNMAESQKPVTGIEITVINGIQESSGSG